MLLINFMYWNLSSAVASRWDIPYGCFFSKMSHNSKPLLYTPDCINFFVNFLSRIMYNHVSCLFSGIPLCKDLLAFSLLSFPITALRERSELLFLPRSQKERHNELQTVENAATHKEMEVQSGQVFLTSINSLNLLYTCCECLLF